MFGNFRPHAVRTWTMSYISRHTSIKNPAQHKSTLHVILVPSTPFLGRTVTALLKREWMGMSVCVETRLLATEHHVGNMHCKGKLNSTVLLSNPDKNPLLELKYPETINDLR